jgi:excinuclease UvrABC ATPase subunit
MTQYIKIKGISTNNLKNIDVSLLKNAINLIIGPSGSGKSSLAYDTIAKIGQHELSSMYSDIPTESQYKVDEYSNMLVTVPIKQNNNNTNIHSTIGTYFNMNAHIALLYSVMLNMPYEYFILNKPENICPQCHGIGYSKELDLNRIIDYNIALEDCPVKCWVRHKDFYKQIIKEFCKDNNIDYTKNFRALSKNERNIFLYGVSEKKYYLRYKHNNFFSQRTTCFYGILTNKPMLRAFNPSSKFFTEKKCSLCNGKKYSQDHDNAVLYGLSIGELMCTPFISLNKWIKKIMTNKNAHHLKFAISEFSNFVNKAIDLNLEYLFFNRTIPSLSGGELQRLRLVQVFNTQLSDLLIILDEPLAGLSGNEKTTVYNNIYKLSAHHTLIIIDHHELFYKNAAIIIALGEKSGKYGGNIIDSKKYISSQANNNVYTRSSYDKRKLLRIKIDNLVYNFTGIEINIVSENKNIISGKSGIGKSTLLREYLPQYFENYCYINQKMIVGKSNSIVATLLGILPYIIDDFAENCGKERKCFSNSSGSDSTCPSCSGTGYVTYGSDFQDKIVMVCNDCEGTGFNKILKRYKIENKTIFDVLNMTIDEASFFYEKRNKKILDVLINAKEILLGHLLVGQHTSSLSGGENIRVKLLRSLDDKILVYGIDEPFRGLNNIEIYSIVLFLDKFIEKKKTIIVADHEEEAFKYFCNHVNVFNDDGKLIGK